LRGKSAHDAWVLHDTAIRHLTFTDQKQVPDRKLQHGTCRAIQMLTLQELAQRLGTGSYTTGAAPGYLFFRDAAPVLGFLEEQWGRPSFTGDGGKGEDDGSWR